MTKNPHSTRNPHSDESTDPGHVARKEAEITGTLVGIVVGALLFVGSSVWAVAQPAPPATEQPSSTPVRPVTPTPPETAGQDNTPATTHAPVAAPIAPTVTPPASSNAQTVSPSGIAGDDQFCLKGSSGNANCIYQDRAGCETAKRAVNSSGDCVYRPQLIETTGSGAPVNPPAGSPPR